MRFALLVFAAIAAAAMPGVSSADTGKDKAMLITAIADRDVPGVHELIEAGADLEARDSQGRTGLLLATRDNEVEIAKALIAAGADVNAKDEIHDTPFLYAGAEGRTEILKAILATGRADLKDTNRYGGTALIPAAHHGHPDAVRVLLETGIDIDHVNNLGWTALIEAVILGDGGPVYQEIVGLLVDAGASNIPDREGALPLDHARRNGFSEIASRVESGPRP
ncbi:hypothetical protein ASD64_15595 [Mesorhizobium sp. Root157]|nr:hypothetical protein ASD64_15595 [Mesorhizobium sp. Root157]